MDNLSYWQKQTPTKPLFANIEWQKPQQKALAGKLLVLGGNAHGFTAVAQAYQDATNAGIGECRVILPNALKKAIDPLALDCLFVPTNLSGGINKEALPAIKAAVAWADGLLLIGDAGRNSETAIVYDQLLTDFADTTTVIARDAIDLLKSSWPQLLTRQNTTLIVTMAQLQKLFQSVYYPKTILFSMQLTNLVEALHKFTTTHAATVVVFHQNQLIVAQQGNITTTPWDQPMLIWRGAVASKAAVYATQNKGQLLQAITASFVAKG